MGLYKDAELVLRLEDSLSTTKQYLQVKLIKKIKLFKQGYILKTFKDTETFFKMLGLNRCTFYFKINIYQLSKKYPHLQYLTLFANYLKK